MADCEGDRDRAIELVRAESESDKRATSLDILRTRIASLGFVLATYVFSRGIDEGPSWFDTAAIIVTVLLIMFISHVLDHDEKRVAGTRQRREEARIAIIEAAYRDCIGGEEE